MKVLDDPKRRSIRRKLAPVIGDEDAENLIAALPSEDDDIATKQFLKGELGAIETKLAVLDIKIGGLEGKFDGLDGKFDKLGERMDWQFRWLMGGVLGSYGAILAALGIGIAVMLRGGGA